MRQSKALLSGCVVIVFVFVQGCSSGPDKYIEAFTRRKDNTLSVESDQEGRWSCKICTARFQVMNDLNAHVTRDHPACPYCEEQGMNVRLGDLEEFRAHYIEAHKDMPTGMSFLMATYVIVVGGGYAAVIAIGGYLL